MSIVDEHGVITGETAETGRPWAFVPVRRILGANEQVWPELRRTCGGQLALVTYTSLALLVDGCGRDQPWMVVPADWFDRVRAECRFDTIAINVPLPAEDRHRTEHDWPGKPEEWDD